MEPGHIIDETATIPGADIEKVYDDCEKWLKTKLNASINEYKFPKYLRAYHSLREHSVGDFKFYGKIISLSLEKEADNVLVNIIMDEPDENPFLHGYENRRRAWFFWVEHLWKYLGVEIDDSMLERWYSPENIRENVSEYIQRIIIWSVILVVVNLLMRRFPSHASIISGGIMASLAFLVMIIIDMTQLIKNRKLQRASS